jgi:hypothetical protein
VHDSRWKFAAGEFNVEWTILDNRGQLERNQKENKWLAKKSKSMTTIVGIFDDAWNVEKAVEQVAAAGFEDTVYDEAIVAEQPGSAGALPFRAPGSAPEKALGSDAPNLLSKPDWNAIVQAFKAQLGRYHLSSDVIRGYATAFLHNGKFVLVRTDAERAEQAIKILRDCDATRVTRHD